MKLEVSDEQAAIIIKALANNLDSTEKVSLDLIDERNTARVRAENLEKETAAQAKYHLRKTEVFEAQLKTLINQNVSLKAQLTKAKKRKKK